MLDGKVFVISENREWWQKALKEAKIEGMRWHDLRHTTASLMSQKNIKLKVIQETLGHRSISTTARYAHLNQVIIADSMAVLNER